MKDDDRAAHGATVRSARVAEKRRERIDRILEAAMRILVDEGVASLTIERVAREIGCTVGALYRYFPAKDAIIAELERRVVVTFRLRFEDAWAILDAGSSELDPSIHALAALWLTVLVYERLPDEYAQRYALIARSLADPQKLVRDEYEVNVVEALSPLLAELGRRIELATALGALRPGRPLERAMSFWACIHGAVTLRKLDRFDPPIFDPATFVRRSSVTLIAGWGASEDALARSFDAASAASARLGPPPRDIASA